MLSAPTALRPYPQAETRSVVSAQPLKSSPLADPSKTRTASSRECRTVRASSEQLSLDAHPGFARRRAATVHGTHFPSHVTDMFLRKGEGVWTYAANLDLSDEQSEQLVHAVAMLQAFERVLHSDPSAATPIGAPVAAPVGAPMKLLETDADAPIRSPSPASTMAIVLPRTRAHSSSGSSDSSAGPEDASAAAGSKSSLTGRGVWDALCRFSGRLPQFSRRPSFSARPTAVTAAR